MFLRSVKRSPRKVSPFPGGKDLVAAGHVFSYRETNDFVGK